MHTKGSWVTFLKLSWLSITYSTMNMDEWDFPAGDVKTAEIRKRQPVQTRTGQVKEHSKHFFVDDLDHPYNEIKPFNSKSLY